MIIHDISVNILQAEPYPGDPETKIETVSSIDNGDEYNLSSFSMCTHTGTHIDAPYHFDNEGKRIGELPKSTFYGKCSVVNIDGIFTGEDVEKILPYCRKRILFKGNGNGFLMFSAAEVLADNHIKLVGIDNASIALQNEEYKTHSILASRNIAVIENLNLTNVKQGHDYTLCAFPIRLDDLEAAPCRAILLEQEKGF